jgi:two-component system nitrogen regulation sensor histidine kinase NtrY
MKLKSNRKFIISFIVGLLLWVIGFSLLNFKLNNQFDQSSIEKFQQKFQQKEENLHHSIDNLSYLLNSHQSLNDLYNFSTDLSKKGDLDIFIYEHDSLIIWTNNHVTIPLTNPNKLINEEVVKLSNGWYYLYKTKTDSFTVYGSFLIKSTFEYENQDLQNSFSPYFAGIIDGEIELPNNENYAIINNENDTIFSIQPSKEYVKNEILEGIVFACYLIIIFIFLQLIISSTQHLLIKKPYLLIAFPIGILAVRFLSIEYNWLNLFDDFKLFSPELFASSEYIPSLGDLIINVSIFYFLVHFLLKRTKTWFKEGNQKINLILFAIPLFLISYYAAFKINDLIYSLVYDSKIAFNLEALFDLDFYSFLSIIIIGACFYAYFKLIQFIVIQLKINEFEWNKLAFLWVITSSGYMVIDLYYFEHSVLTSIWPLILSGSLVWFEFKEKSYKFIHVMSILAFISFYAAYILQDYSNLKEKEIRKVYAEEIATDEDPITEIDYDDIESKLRKSEFLIQCMYDSISQTYFNESIENNYFNKLKTKYDLIYHLFNSDKKRILDYTNNTIISYEKFNSIVQNTGEISSINPHIYFIKNYTEKLSYLIDYPVMKNDSVYGYLIVEMRSKKFPIDIGLPSLLLEKGTKSITELKDYSIAKYIDGKLVSTKGEFSYPFEPADWFYSDKDYYVKDGYNHYILISEDGKYNILSKKESTLISLVTAFSYLLIIYGVFLLIPLFYQEFKGIKFSLKNVSLNVRIQTVLIGLILLSLIVFGIGAGTFVIKQYHTSSKAFIEEKTGSVNTELQNKLGDENELNSGYLEYLLKKFSSVFVTDINLYDINGNLLASSQPKIYSKGLVSKKMNHIAFGKLGLDKKSEFIHTEKIGNLDYLSSYVPFVNKDGKLLAYLNLQYISKQDELQNQISGFLLAIINIMVLMLAISTILAIILSNRLTSPLKFIKDSLNKVQLGSANNEIEYEGTDEIGDLVQEYNRKVAELQESASQLAKNERESAWREMAKQVAHEIKNPLTPMKLSIQHMKRSIEVKDEASQNKLNRVTASLIEQIDALTKIANEFSNFAKMPKAIEEETNLTTILENAYAVFAQHESHQIEFNNHIDSDAIIWADKALCLRVFNNLIKNAIQAIPSTEEGLIKINLSEEDDTFLVEIRDSGVGISDDQASKIFVPYFTTKSTGTGLGLAMSKQIIDNMKGQIHFKSTIGKGTSFFVSFPKYQTN